MTIPTLSFCITCKNRFHQISRTLRENLDDNILFKNSIEFIVVDFASNDGLRKWITDNFEKELKEGYLKYYYTEELPYWHASIAKNTSHLLGNNEILINLDCDNFTGYNGGRYVIQHFVEYDNIVLHQFNGNYLGGTYGRISMKQKDFYSVGGYDESFEPMSMQDEDILYRLQAIGNHYIQSDNRKYNTAIVNTKEEGLLYTNSKIGYEEMLRRNRIISESNLRKGKFKVNGDNWGIRKNIYDIDGKPFFTHNEYTGLASRNRRPL